MVYSKLSVIIVIDVLILRTSGEDFTFRKLDEI